MNLSNRLVELARKLAPGVERVKIIVLSWEWPSSHYQSHIVGLCKPLPPNYAPQNYAQVLQHYALNMQCLSQQRCSATLNFDDICHKTANYNAFATLNFDDICHKTAGNVVDDGKTDKTLKKTDKTLKCWSENAKLCARMWDIAKLCKNAWNTEIFAFQCARITA